MIQIISTVLAAAAIASVLIVYACCVVAGRADETAQQIMIPRETDGEK